ncbi:RNA polymerase sigma factor [Streptomyces sp. NPDC059837]|jgi:RNA polymerase sigma-70 factor (ECF subfamily)|uniref:RNA polymerase sigma factor n=1 Tax=unclassified Streptomyces TaxID=2593676 RepID=UPI002253B18C|nr:MULTISPECIES: sigma-70 family RNA polymerase sigma factor [unclassified Streptomyces]MCX4408231.1 sigma-70 family RNA polymerase sigma factor [Streptomyces sp. NBC_01764]MCX5186218.1 sigma-70 family RNA polymerase sigma factor [Streptomyces sp. NBC_00268]
MTEEESRQRQRARFERLAHVVVEPLHRYLLRRTSADMVDDILAEAMLVLWRRIDDVPGLGSAPGSLPDPDDVLPWCYGVARGCLANARRADGRRLRLVERLIRTQEQLPAGVADHSDLHAALAALGALDREVVRLWAWEGLAPRQIAEATGLTSNAVSIRLHRAKKKLAEQLRRKHDEPSGHKRDEGRSGQ